MIEFILKVVGFVKVCISLILILWFYYLFVYWITAIYFALDTVGLFISKRGTFYLHVLLIFPIDFILTKLLQKYVYNWVFFVHFTF